jgi:predicted transcriptional regulator
MFPSDVEGHEISHFGASVSAALAERQLSQADLAEVLGRSPAYLTKR